jgi:hypothetical protein
MELVLVLALLVIALVLGITPPNDRGSKVEEVWPESSFE